MFKSKIYLPIVCLASICLLVPTTRQVEANSLSLETSQLNSYSVAQKIPRLRFKLPSRGVPGARVSGATRQGSNYVTAIIPSKKLGLTASESPTLFVYIPENQSASANLVITDEQGKQLYQSDFTVPQEAGILRIKLPETVNLETDKIYKWQVQLNSENSSPMMNFKLKTFGWVEKVPLVENSLNSLAEEETWANLNTLAEAGIWHDTLEQLAMLRLENPEDIQLEAEWTELLTSVGLSNVAHSNILPEVVEVK